MDIKAVVDQEVGVVDFLHQKSGLKKARVKEAMQKGAVWLTPAKQRRAKRIRRADRQLEAGDTIDLYYASHVLDSIPPPPELLVDEDAYSLWYKPSGLMSSGSRYGDHHSIVRWVEQHLDRTTFLVHRLDRFTRGLMVLAHSKTAAGALAQQFRERSVIKRYQARVEGLLKGEHRISVPVGGKPAVSNVQVLLSGAESLVEVHIETGRKHQIRQHLAHIGHPVVGDVAYGDAAEGDLQLISVSLGFCCPVSQEQRRYELPVEYRFA